MRTFLAIVVLLTFGLAACSEQRERQAAAIAAFGAFQEALFAGDRMALAATVTASSARTLGGADLAQVAQQEPLTVLDCEVQGAEYLVHVRDPNLERRATFVVVREDGRMRVDLVATAAWHQVKVEHPEGTPRFRIDPVPESEKAAFRARAAEAALRERR